MGALAVLEALSEALRLLKRRGANELGQLLAGDSSAFFDELSLFERQADLKDF